MGAYEPGEYVAFMDELGIAASVIFTIDGLIGPSPAANDGVAAFVTGHPGRLVGFGTVDPRSAEARRCLEMLGFAGFKVHPWLQGFAPHESRGRTDRRGPTA
jgi:predicted TIM-barrel fold metal-dependent hydrolase